MCFSDILAPWLVCYHFYPVKASCDAWVFSCSIEIIESISKGASKKITGFARKSSLNIWLYNIHHTSVWYTTLSKAALVGLRKCLEEKSSVWRNWGSLPPSTPLSHLFMQLWSFSLLCPLHFGTLVLSCFTVCVALCFVSANVGEERLA